MYSFENKFPLWRTHEGRTPRTYQIVLDDEIINVYPDNDGNVWYYHPKTREKVIIIC